MRAEQALRGIPFEGGSFSSSPPLSAHASAPYEIKRYERDAATRLAPPELEAVHPLGKAPVTARRSSAGLPKAGITVSRNSGGRRLPIPVFCLNIAPEPQNLGQSGQMWYLARAASDRHS
jgi:hypothetical protein